MRTTLSQQGLYNIGTVRGLFVDSIARLGALGSLLSVNASLLTHGSKDDNVYQKLLTKKFIRQDTPASSKNAVYNSSLDWREQLTGILLFVGFGFGGGEERIELLDKIQIIRLLDIVLQVATVIHEGEVTVVGDVDLATTLVHWQDFADLG